MPPPRFTRSNPRPHPDQDAHYGQNNLPMDSESIETLVAQRVANAMPTFEANCNTRFGLGVGGDSSQGEKRGPPRACTYKDIIN